MSVYRVDFSGQINRVTDDIDAPNGLCFSPDYSLLYVANTGAGRDIKVWDVDGSRLRNGRVFAELVDPTTGSRTSADGIRCDVDGNVWAGARPGVQIVAPDGDTIGVIRLPEVCANVCFGEAIVDDCGICGGDNSTCADCSGTPNGDAVEDQCGTCDSDSSNDCVQDCAGVWGGADAINNYYFDADLDGLGAGDAVEFCSAFVADGYVTNADDIDDDCFSNSHDDCGVCDGGNADMDCAGVCFGEAYLDDCNVCSAGTTNHEGNSDQDCAGVCDGDSYVDNCGDCDNDPSNDDLSCSGCTDSCADNYDDSASIEDESCEFSVDTINDLAAASGPSRIILSWTAPSSVCGVSSYNVYDTGDALVKETSSTSTQIVGLDAGVEYCFTVKAVTDNAESDFSNEACATPEASEGLSWGLNLSAEINGWGSFIENNSLKLMQSVSLPTAWSFKELDETQYIFSKFHSNSNPN